MFDQSRKLVHDENSCPSEAFLFLLYSHGFSGVRKARPVAPTTTSTILRPLPTSYILLRQPRPSILNVHFPRYLLLLLSLFETKRQSRR